MYVYGAPISCLCVIHLGVPNILLYIHVVRYASLLFVSLHIFSPVYNILFFYAVILSLSQIMCISVCNKICSYILSYPHTFIHVCMHITQCSRYKALLFFAYSIYFVCELTHIQNLFCLLCCLYSLLFLYSILSVFTHTIDMIKNKCSYYPYT